MSEENSNSQTQQAAPVTPAGPSMEEVKAQMQAEFDRTREGLIRDLQQERSKRQELEQRLSPPASSPANKDVSQDDELGRVLNPYIQPVRQELEATKAQLAQYEQDKAMGYLSEKTGKTREAILNDTVFQQRLVSTAQKWGLRGNTYDVTQKAMELMELEDLKVKETERARASRTTQNASMPSGAPPAPVTQGKEFSAQEFNSMSSGEFTVMSSKGDFRKTSEGKFVYTPRS
jgi:hypothetical protein